MRERGRGQLVAVFCLLWGVCAGSTGCWNSMLEHRCPDAHVVEHDPTLPHELQMMSLPPYVIEPPDILLIDVLRTVPKPPYRVEPGDALMIQAGPSPPGFAPLGGVYTVEPEGTINFGVDYGVARVAGLTLEEAREAIRKQLATTIKKEALYVSVALAQSRAMQQIRGQHLVRPDGTVGLGLYGSVYVAGMTLAQAKQAIEEQLSKSLQQPEISIDVFSYNSKWYYVIFDGAGYGQQVIRLPITGKETVLDAVSMVYGLTPVSSKHHIWVARPNSIDSCGDKDNAQVLPVDWLAIARCGSTETNYQLLPNDRVYVQANSLITLNNALSMFFAPLERIFGATLLGTTTVEQIRFFNRAGTGGLGGLGIIR
jgi:polysaccharide biosynthesis/export protein